MNWCRPPGRRCWIVSESAMRPARRRCAPCSRCPRSLLSETHSDALLDLILNAILGHLRCSHAAYYEYSVAEGRFALLRGRGKELPDFIIQVDANASPMLVNASGPGDSQAQARLQKAELGAAMFIPIARQRFRGVFFAARDPGEAGFRDVDIDMFQILARQAAAAIENARLYEEQRAYVRTIEESQAALLQAEKMAAAGRLSASIAHEINNPLQSVQNCLHLAAREDLPQDKRTEYFDLGQGGTGATVSDCPANAGFLPARCFKAGESRACGSVGVHPQPDPQAARTNAASV